MKKLLKGGTVVSGGGSVLADVVLDGEKVAAVGLPRDMEELAGMPRLWTFPAVCCFQDLSTPTPILTSMWRGR